MIKKTTAKETLEKLGKKCDRCGHCCTYGSGFVLDEEIPELAKGVGTDVESFKKEYLEEITKFNTTLHRFRQVRESKPYGYCIFLTKEKTCSIHSIKPLHCRIASCGEHGEDINEWFIVNHFVNRTDTESMREWQTRLKIKKTIEGGDVRSLIPEKKEREKVLRREVRR